MGRHTLGSRVTVVRRPVATWNRTGRNWNDGYGWSRTLSFLRRGALREVFVAKLFSDGELRAAAAALPLARGQHLDSFRDAG